jgi:hypothetical protein
MLPTACRMPTVPHALPIPVVPQGRVKVSLQVNYCCLSAEETLDAPTVWCM